MSNNTLIRTLTLTFIALCFIAMFVIASFSAQADLRPAASEPKMISLSAEAGQSEPFLEALFSPAAENENSGNPSMW